MIDEVDIVEVEIDGVKIENITKRISYYRFVPIGSSTSQRFRSEPGT